VLTPPSSGATGAASGSGSSPSSEIGKAVDGGVNAVKRIFR